MSRILGISRHRLGSDGVGVTTLVGFFGCPLRCRYCLNPKCFDKDAKSYDLSPQELYEKLKIDDLYFKATGGGVTFGGGEPLLNCSFIKEFRGLCGDTWKINVETCLNVPFENILEASDAIDGFFVDVKDTNPEIYRCYTGCDNALVLENLKLLIEKKGSDAITVRLPLIKGYNTESDREKSEKLLQELGITSFDKFEYRIKTT